MNKSKEEVLGCIQETLTDHVKCLRLMLLGSYLNKKHMEEAEKAYAGCEKAYEEYQKYVRSVKQVTKEES